MVRSVDVLCCCNSPEPRGEPKTEQPEPIREAPQPEPEWQSSRASVTEPARQPEKPVGTDRVTKPVIYSITAVLQ